MNMIVSGGEDPSSAAVSPSTEVEGDIAHDAVDSGNPVKIGGKATENLSAEPDVDSNDRVDAAFTRKGAQIIAGAGSISDGSSSGYVTIPDDADSERVLGAGIFGVAPDTSADRLRTIGNTSGAGLGVLAIGARTPDSSEVKTLVVGIGATSAARATFLTPTSGKKVRVLSFRVSAQNLTTDPDEVQVYFGTGAAVTTNAASIIGIYDTGTDGTDEDKFPEGAGPVGAADAVVSWRTETETETGLLGVLVYREE